MKIMTWNIDNDQINVIERSKKLIEIINNINPDIICLQEVTLPMYNSLITYLIDYKHTLFDNSKSYNIMIFFKNNIENIEEISYKKLTSLMSREVVIFKMKSITLINVHLDSSPINKDIRIKQIDEIKQIINNDINVNNNIVICGDMNFIFEDETITNFIDYSPKEPSYNYITNKRILGPWISRLDRVFSNNEVKNSEIYTKNVEEVSDHFILIFNI